MKPIHELIKIPGPPEGGWEARDLEVGELRKEAEERHQRDRVQAERVSMVSWGVPAKDVDRITLTRLDETDSWKEVRRFNEQEVGGCILILAGSVGCGKTTAAAWWLSQPGPRDRYVVTTPPMFIPTFRLERLSRYSEEGMRKVEKARRLVIDDLGTEYSDSKDNFLTLFRSVIDSRYSDMLPLIVTTNLDADEFKSRYGSRTVSRIREAGKFHVVQGDDLRRR